MRRIAIASGGLVIAAAVGAADVAAASAAPAAPVGEPAAATSLTAATTTTAAAVSARVTPVQAAKRKRYYVKQGPRFNLPTGDLQQQGAIDLYIKKLIRHAPKGSEIDVSLFRLQTEGMAKELVRAKNRKVKVRIVIDSDSLNYRRGVFNYLRRHLGGNTKKSSWIITCPTGRGCIAPAAKGEWSKNHNKFYAFSTTYDSRKVVVQTSGNATGGMYNQYNDSYTMVDTKLYNAYRKYFYDLAKHKANGNYFRTYPSGFRSVSYFPKATGDPIGYVLDQVSCSGGTKIRLSSGVFTRTGVSSRLSKLDDAGCDVKVVSGSLGESTAKALAKPGRHSGPQVHVFASNQSKRAHSKYLLIDGMYKGRRHKVVLTGSHSYTTDALRHNDEAVVNIDHGWTYDQYLKNFNRVFAAAKATLSIAPWNQLKTVPDDATDPEDGQTTATKPGTGTGTPSTGTPSTGTPGTGTPNTESPDAGDPESGTPGTPDPEAEVPSADGQDTPPADGLPSTDGQ